LAAGVAGAATAARFTGALAPYHAMIEQVNIPRRGDFQV
jgi:hypothetical protein